MSWEAWVEQAVHRGGFWMIHINRIAVLVLVTATALSFSARILLLRMYSERLAKLGAPGAARDRLHRMLLAGLTVAGLSGYFAVKPDEAFYTTVADSAFAERDYKRAILFYGPLVQWGTRSPRICLALGRSHLELRQCRPALDALDCAISLPGGDSTEARVLRAFAYQCVGATPLAIQDLDRAIHLSTRPEERARLRGYAESLREKAGRPGP